MDISTIKELPSTLYIIGNGFDRYHGLETRYQAFALFLKEFYKDIYGLFIKYYALSDLDPDDNNSLRDPLWADFENALAGLDFRSVLDDNSNYAANPSGPDFRDRDWHSFTIKMEGIVDQLTKETGEAFKEFILDVEFPSLKPNIELGLEPNSIFLNFNYTDTLERYYFINKSKILYIHGKANISKGGIILGHGVTPMEPEEETVTVPEGLTEEELEWWLDQQSNQYDYSYDQAKEQIMSYFWDSYKPTQKIIEKNNPFFERLRQVKKIFVLGHSIAIVDQPYFVKIIHSVSTNDVQWIVSYYSDAERDALLNKLTSLGLKVSQIDLIKMTELVRVVPTLFD